jgi:hypothetical protein
MPLKNKKSKAARSGTSTAVKNGVTTTTKTKRSGATKTTMTGGGYNLTKKVSPSGKSRIKGTITTKKKKYSVNEKGVQRKTY